MVFCRTLGTVQNVMQHTFPLMLELTKTKLEAALGEPLVQQTESLLLCLSRVCLSKSPRCIVSYYKPQNGMHFAQAKASALAVAPMEFSGKERLFVATARMSAETGEALSLRANLLSKVRNLSC